MDKELIKHIFEFENFKNCIQKSIKEFDKQTKCTDNNCIFCKTTEKPEPKEVKEPEFKVGDVVVLKSGSMPMTISSINTDKGFIQLLCVFIENSEIHQIQLNSKLCELIFTPTSTSTFDIPHQNSLTKDGFDITIKDEIKINNDCYDRFIFKNNKDIYVEFSDKVYIRKLFYSVIIDYAEMVSHNQVYYSKIQKAIKFIESL